jgi:hypothetical protein
MDLLAFAQWCEESALGLAIRESTWAFAVIESIHLLALSVIGGTVLVVDLRLLGAGLTRHSVKSVAAEVWKWQNLSLAVMIITGILLYLSEATKCYYSTPFWVKMGALITSIVFLYAVKKPLVFSDRPTSRITGALVALFSLGVWFVVGAAGRWIGFSG